MIPKKLGCQEVLMILALYWNFDASIYSLSQYFKIGEKSIRRIIGGKSYKDCYRPSMLGFSSYQDMDAGRIDKSFYLRRLYGRGRPSKSVEEILAEIDVDYFRKYFGLPAYMG